MANTWHACCVLVPMRPWRRLRPEEGQSHAQGLTAVQTELGHTPSTAGSRSQARPRPSHPNKEGDGREGVLRAQEKA